VHEKSLIEGQCEPNYQRHISTILTKKRVNFVSLWTGIKKGTHDTRGTGTSRHVCDNAEIPLNWKSFLRLDDNKKELFQHLVASVQSLHIANVEVISKADVDATCSTTIVKAGLAHCNHEEADTCIFIHAKHASVNGIDRFHKWLPIFELLIQKNFYS